MLRRLVPRFLLLAVLGLGVFGCAELLEIKLPPVLQPPTQTPPPSSSPPSSPTPPSSPSGAFGGCQIDANCEEARAWANEARAIVNTRLVDNRTMPGCTGVLLNNTRGDRTPYVLVARHCRNGQLANVGENLNWWTFYFRRTSDRCNAEVSADPGPCTDANRCIQGATVVATGSAQGSYTRNRDYMLLRLNRPIPSSWNVTYAGWSIESALPRTATILGHPRGLPLAFAASDRPVVDNTSCDPEGSMLSIEIDRGQLVRGQSGSPVFDEQRAVRGVIITGSNCNHPSRTCAASLAYNWTYGSSGNRLVDHLAGGDLRVRSVRAR